MSDLRRNAIVGVIDQDGLQPTSMHVAEWWNGEGFDVCFDDGDVIKLHQTQLQALVILALATEYVDLEEIQQQVAELIDQSKNRATRLESIRSDIAKHEQAMERRQSMKVVHRDEP